MELLTSKLDVLQSETTDDAYESYSKFINFSWQDNNDIGDNLEFGNLYKRMWDFEMKLQDVVLTFKLLDGAKGIIIIIFTFTHNRKRFFLGHVYILLHK